MRRKRSFLSFANKTNVQAFIFENSIGLIATKCWLWNRHVDSQGYGIIVIDGKARKVHRVMFELTNGGLAPSLVLDHFIRNTNYYGCYRHCLNPDHLEAITPAAHVLRSPIFMQRASEAARKIGSINGKARRRDNLPDGVTKSNSRYRVRIYLYKKKLDIGTYDTVEEASRVYQDAVVLRDSGQENLIQVKRTRKW